MEKNNCQAAGIPLHMRQYLYTSFPNHFKRRQVQLLFPFIFILLLFAPKLSAQLPAGFLLDEIQDGYTAPMGVVFSSNGNSMFVWDRSGHVYVSKWNGTTYVKQILAFLDISDEVGNWGDFGLLSFCLDPDFDQNGLVYLYYVVDRHHLRYSGTPQYDSTVNEYLNATIGRVTRYRLNLAEIITTDYSSRQILIGESAKTGIPLVEGAHMGGTLVFGRDKTVLLSTGDAANFNTTDTGSLPQTYYQQALTDSIIRPAENVGAFRSQMVNSLNGKILRFDRNTGDGIASNPFFDSVNPRSPRSRVWALGFRNPFRMSLQPNTGSINPQDANPGTLLIGDVGYGTWEELNIVNTRGLNFGWPLYEGQVTNSLYSAVNTINQDEGQPFKNLCSQPVSFVLDSVITNRRFSHYRSDLAWRHGVPDTRVPWFNGSTPTDPMLNASGSPTIGENFRGNCAIGGVYYTGTIFGPSYQNTYFFADFSRNWIKVAYLNAGHPSISKISNFAPESFTRGIVDMEQNPLDNSIYYVNTFVGEIMRINFEGNFPPVVSFTNPVAPAIFAAGSTIQVQVSATDQDGLVTRVELFYNGIKLDQDSTAPFIFTGANVEAGLYKLVAKATDDSNAVSISDTLTVTVPSCSGSGTISGEGYTNIPGSQVADLTSNPSYPGNPSINAQLDVFEYAGVGDNYGGRIRGYICAPLTGDYTFYIAGDDQAGVFLSTDENPANKVLIAYNETPVNFRAWTTTTTQKSAPIRLINGARYYIETLHKQSTGVNHLSVGWVLPDGSQEGPIPGNRLSPFVIAPLTARAPMQDLSEVTENNNLKGLKVSATPNPSRNDFTILTSSNSDQRLTITVNDILGRVIEKKEKIPANGTIQLGNKLMAGVYFVEIRQGPNRKVIKLIKQ